MNEVEVLVLFERWQLDLTRVREQVYQAPTPRERERWHERVAHVLADLTARSRERQVWDAGLGWADQLLVLDPWREAAHQEKMRLLALSGRRDTALAHYQIYRRILVDKLGAVVRFTPSCDSLYNRRGGCPSLARCVYG